MPGATDPSHDAHSALAQGYRIHDSTQVTPSYSHMVAQHDLVGGAANARAPARARSRERPRAGAGARAEAAAARVHIQQRNVGEIMDILVPQIQEQHVEVVKVHQQALFTADGASIGFTAADQEQSTSESQPSVSHPGMSCTAAGGRR